MNNPVIDFHVNIYCRNPSYKRPHRPSSLGLFLSPQRLTTDAMEEESELQPKEALLWLQWKGPFTLEWLHAPHEVMGWWFLLVGTTFHPPCLLYIDFSQRHLLQLPSSALTPGRGVPVHENFSYFRFRPVFHFFTHPPTLLLRLSALGIRRHMR